MLLSILIKQAVVCAALINFVFCFSVSRNYCVHYNSNSCFILLPLCLANFCKLLLFELMIVCFIDRRFILTPGLYIENEIIIAFSCLAS